MEKEFVGLERVHVACDTGVLWRIIDGQAPWLADFVQMAKVGVVFSLADHALAEIINQFDQGRFTDAEYASGVAEVDRFISPDIPVLPGKRRLAGWCADAPDAAALDDDVLHGRATWDLIKTSKTATDLERMVVCVREDGSKFRMQMTCGDADAVLQTERDNWIAHIEQNRPDWRKKPLDDRLRELAAGVTADIVCVPPILTRLDAAFRHQDEIIGLRSDPKHPFNPRKEESRNDGIDYSMSFVFIKRIVVCTADKKYRDRIRNLKSFQSLWIYDPDELVAAWKNGTLVRPAWP